MKKNLGIIQVIINSKIELSDSFGSIVAFDITSQLSDKEIEEIKHAFLNTKIINLVFKDVVDADASKGLITLFSLPNEIVGDYIYLCGTMVDSVTYLAHSVAIGFDTENNVVEITC